MKFRANNPVITFLYNGKPVVGGFVCTYDSVTDEEIATFADETGEVLNPVRIPLDSNGSCEIFLDADRFYKFAVLDRYGVPLYIKDKVYANIEDYVNRRLAMVVSGESIFSKLDGLDESLVDIAESIEGKGVEVPEGTKLDGMAPLIDQIVQGGSGGVLFEYRRVSMEVGGAIVVDEDGYVVFKYPYHIPHLGKSYQGNYVLALKGVKLQNPTQGKVPWLVFGSDEILGDDYDTTKIGLYEWTTASLRYTEGIVLYGSEPVDEDTPAYKVSPNGEYLYNSAAVDLIIERLNSQGSAYWHVPSQSEIGTTELGANLKSVSGWNTEYQNGNGVDIYGFNAKPTDTSEFTSGLNYFAWSNANTMEGKVAIKIDFGGVQTLVSLAKSAEPTAYIRLCRRWDI